MGQRHQRLIKALATTARYAVCEGLLDLVGMTRALLADPYLPRKLAEGHTDEIRPCVGANMCIDNIYTSGAAYCLHNPSTGRELEVPHQIQRAPRVRRVAVVGAGPAGLEAARILGERGHDVTVFEASSAVDGQLLIAAQSQRRRDLQGIVDWRSQELARIEVSVRLNTYVDPDLLGAEPYDRRHRRHRGRCRPSRLFRVGTSPSTHGTCFQVTHARAAASSYTTTMAVNQALDAAEALLRSGSTVEIVSPERSLSPDVGGLVASLYFDALIKQGVTMTMLRRIRRIERHEGRFKVTFGLDSSEWEETGTFDAVVAESGTEPNAELYTQLLDGSTNQGEVNLDALLNLREQTTVRNPRGRYQLFRIGDALTGRNVHAAMLDAARLCRAI